MAMESISVGQMQNTLASRNEEKRRKIFDLLNDDLDNEDRQDAKQRSQASVQVLSIRHHMESSQASVLDEPAQSNILGLKPYNLATKDQWGFVPEDSLQSNRM